MCTLLAHDGHHRSSVPSRVGAARARQLLLQSFFGPAGVAICGQPAPVLHGLHASTRARSTRSLYPQLLRGRPNQLLSHVDACLALLRLLKMLSKFTESEEANNKMMGEKMSGKVIAATSVIASYEERGEGECTHTPVSTTISTAASKS